MEFQPYSYKKDYKKDPADSSFWNNTLPLMLIFFGSLIISSQIVLPYFSFPTQNNFTVRPVKTFKVLGASQEVQEQKKRVTDTKHEQIPPKFFLSIPKLEIERAVVKKDTTEADPREFLGHLLGSALPGDNGGGIFIYGHSTFPWLFDADNYRTIFSNLPKLERGDIVKLEYPGRTWLYKVNGFKTLTPEEVNPYDSGSGEGSARLVLMTCVPPGTRLRRLLVYATLVESIDR